VQAQLAEEPLKIALYSPTTEHTTAEGVKRGMHLYCDYVVMGCIDHRMLLIVISTCRSVEEL